MADAPAPSPQDEQESPYKIVRPDQHLTMEWVPRRVRMYSLNENEVDTLSSSGSALPLAFFGVSFGACASFASVVLSGSVPDPKAYATCFAIALSTGVLSAFFFAWSVVGEVKARNTRKQIKQGKVI